MIGSFTRKSSSIHSTFINLMFVKRRVDDSGNTSVIEDLKELDKDQYVIWNSKEHPDWVISMSHSMHGSGVANDLSLSLFHRIDPYVGTSHGESFYGSVLNEDGVNTDQPSFLLSLINDSFNTIFFQYGYAQEDGGPDLVIIDESKKENRTDNSWFKMYITDVHHSFDANGVTVDITAVSTLVNSENVFGTDVGGYDWLGDTENRLKLNKNSNYVDRLKAIIRWFANNGTQTFNVNFSDLDKHPIPTDKMKDFMCPLNTESDDTSAESTNLFEQGNKGNFEFIADLLNNLVTWSIVNNVKYEENGVEKVVDSAYAYYQGWTFIVDDKAVGGYAGTPKVTITWQTVSYTRKDLNDIYRRIYKPENIVLQRDIDYYNTNYKPFYTDLNSENASGLTSLFYNFPSFDRDMFDTMSIGGSDLSEYSEEFLKQFSADAKVGVDVISLDLVDESLIAGVAQNIKEGLVYYANDNGEDSNVPYESTIGSDVTKDTLDQGTATSKASNFNKVLHQLFISGSVTLPGLGKIVNILSNVAIYIYVSNRLDPQSGMYRITDQTDIINGGQYTTQLTVYKVLSLHGGRVPLMDDERNSTLNDFSGVSLGVGNIDIVDTGTSSSKKVSSAEVIAYEGFNVTNQTYSKQLSLSESSIPSRKGYTVINNSIVEVNGTPTLCFIFNPRVGALHLTEDQTFYYSLLDMEKGVYISPYSTDSTKTYAVNPTYNIASNTNMLPLYTSSVTNAGTSNTVYYKKEDDGHIYAYVKLRESLLTNYHNYNLKVLFSVDGKPATTESLKDSNAICAIFRFRYKKQ